MAAEQLIAVPGCRQEILHHGELAAHGFLAPIRPHRGRSLAQQSQLLRVSERVHPSKCKATRHQLVSQPCSGEAFYMFDRHLDIRDPSGL